TTAVPLLQVVNPAPAQGTPVLQEQSHLDDVPELAARPAHVLLPVALFLEAELPVQSDGCLVVRKDAQRQLVQPLLAAPVDRSRNERRADAAAAPLASDQHSDLAEAEAGSLDVQKADDVAARGGDQRPVEVP